jgi:hypothetical protein
MYHAKLMKGRTKFLSPNITRGDKTLIQQAYLPTFMLFKVWSVTICLWQTTADTKTNAIPENCALLGYYTASSGNFLPTFRDNLSVPSSGAKNTFLEPIGCPETSVRNYNSALHNIPKGSRSHLRSGGSLKGRNGFMVRSLLGRTTKTYFQFSSAA